MAGGLLFGKKLLVTRDSHTAAEIGAALSDGWPGWVRNLMMNTKTI